MKSVISFYKECRMELRRETGTNVSVLKEVLYSVTFLIYETVSMSYSYHIKSVLAQLCQKMHLVCIEIAVLCHENHFSGVSCFKVSA